MGNADNNSADLVKLKAELKKLDYAITELTLQLPPDFDLIEDDELSNEAEQSDKGKQVKDKQPSRKSYLPSWAGTNTSWNETLRFLNDIRKSQEEQNNASKAKVGESLSSNSEADIDEVSDLKQQIELKKQEKQYLEDSLKRLRDKNLLNDKPSEEEIRAYQEDILNRQPNTSPSEVISDSFNRTATAPVVGTMYNSRRMIFKGIMTVGVKGGYFNNQNAAGFKTLQFLAGGNRHKRLEERKTDETDFFVGKVVAVAGKTEDGKFKNVTFQIQSPENRQGKFKEMNVDAAPEIVNNVSLGGTYFIATPGWKEEIALMDENSLENKCRVDRATDYYAKRKIKEITGEIIKIDVEGSIWVMLPLLKVKLPRVIKFTQEEHKLDSAKRLDIVTLTLPGQNQSKDRQHGIGNL